MCDDPHWRRLMTVPGVGPVMALAPNPAIWRNVSCAATTRSLLLRGTQVLLTRTTTEVRIGRKLLCIAFVVLGVVPPQGGFAGNDRPVRSLLEMRRENVVVQEWELSCGAAALATLLQYQHGDAVSEREIAKEIIGHEEYAANPSKLPAQRGFSLLDLKRFVDQRGYEGVGYGKMTLKDLIARAPIIVPISANGYNHFVIFRGVMDDRVLLADPAWGNRTMLADEFESMWLDYPTFGRVGFVVIKRGEASSSRLAPRAEEFLILR